MALNLHQIIGKTRIDSNGNKVPGFTVLEHSILVGAAAVALSKYYPLLKEEAGIPYFFSLHDVGKVSPGFQAQISCALSPNGVSTFSGTQGITFQNLTSPSTPYCRFHEEGAEYHFSRIGGGNLKLDKASRHVLRVHHGIIRNKSIPLTPHTMGSGVWVDLRNELCDKLGNVFGNILPNRKFIKKNQDLLSGLLCLSDWIGSDEDIFETDPSSTNYPFSIGWTLQNLVNIADGGIQTRGLGAIIQMTGSGLSFGNLFNGWSPKPIQQALIDQVNGPGVYILEAPMGVGKTEAALYAAYSCIDRGLASGFYFGLPTQVTSNKIHQRINFVQAGLLHGGSKLYLQSQGRQPSYHSWFNNNKRAILLPAGVGTIDQALMSVMPKKKHYYLRTLGLLNKVLILDEVHSYDAYTGTLLKHLIAKGHIVILLSATLTTEAKSKLLGIEDSSSLSAKSYPLVTSYHKDEKTTSISSVSINQKIKDLTYDMDTYGDRGAYLKEAIKKARQGYKVLWFENIVDEAQEVYGRIPDDVNKGLLHSRFTKRGRDINESKWIGIYGKGSPSGTGSILVSTQVAEQSLDIDADIMYTSLCPSDMLLQRMGRVWRHNRNRPAGCEVPEIKVHYGNLKPEAKDIHELSKIYGSKTPYVYDPYVLYKTLQVIQGRKNISIPSDIRDILEKTYDGDHPQTWSSWKSLMDIDSKQKYEKASGTVSSGQGGPLEDDTIPGNMDDATASTRWENGSDVLEVIMVDSMPKGNSVTIDGEIVDLSDWKTAIIQDERKIKVSPKKLGFDPIELKPKRFPLHIIVKNVSGQVLDEKGKPSGNVYSSTVGLKYAIKVKGAKP